MKDLPHILRTVIFFVLVTAAIAVDTTAQTRIHEVKQGETLISIAQAYQMTATELRVLNKLANERIDVGQRLRVRDVEPIGPLSATQVTSGVGIDPSKIDTQAQRDTTRYMSRGVESTPKPDTLKAPQQRVAPSSAQHRVMEAEHMVQPGETLFGIANKYGMLVSDLKRRNGIVGNDVTAGQRLKVMVEQAPAEQQQTEQKGDQGQEPNPEQRASVFDPQKHDWYQVKGSDTLPSIARLFGMSIAQLRDLNGSKIYTLSAGDRIIVFNKAEQETPSEPETTASLPPTAPPAQSQPPQSELKPPVELVEPPAVTTERAKAVEDTSVNVPAVQEVDPFRRVVNRGQFIGYVVKRNERLSSILDAFQMDESDFFALNPALNGRPPRANDEVLVYEPPSNLQPNPYNVDIESSSAGNTVSVSVYQDADRGRLTASGELYNPDNLTAASNNYPLGSILFILNPETGKGTYVRINDKTDAEGILLSRSAATMIGLNPSGVNEVMVNKEQ